VETVRPALIRFADVPAYSGLLVLLALASGCDREAGPPAPPPGEGPAAAPEAFDAPIRALYLCANRFVLLNEHPFPVRISWRVQGTDEHGEQTLKAAPAGDPEFSEVEVSVKQQGALAVYRGDELLTVRENERTACEPIVGSPSLDIAGSSTVGEWSAPTPWPIVALHTHLLFNGSVLAWGKFGDPVVWDPATNTFTPHPVGSNLFCSGHAMTSTGQLFVAGGHISDAHGLPDANTYTPGTATWTSLPPMSHGRWYPTVTELPNGQFLVVGGKDQNGLTVTIPELWTGTAWKELTAAARTFPYYPRNFVAPNSKIFYAGEQRTTRYFNPLGTNGWSKVADRLYGTRDYGSAVMYLPGKILYVGGGRTTATAETIDLNVATPVWKWTGSMAYPRRHLNATVLPTGEVLVTGGVSGTSFNETSMGVRVAEIWNPATGVWTQLASNAVTRGYHATSILLPDGRVLHTGSGDALDDNGNPYPDERSGELFSPPYLFKGPRPTITSGPADRFYGGIATIGTPAPAEITKVSLIAIGSATHAFDSNQRFLWLTFTRTSTALSVKMPTKNLAPPGYYMLFVLNGNDVPSVGRMIRLH
jgi:galactose oxidase-like protein/glyoxal oxidase-like protein